MSGLNLESPMDNLDVDPFIQFSKWFSERQPPAEEETGTAVLATSGIYGRPSARMVLVKEFSRKGFVFYTNYGSRKAIQIFENPYGALLFYWPEIHRQVRIEGEIKKVTVSKSTAYFRKRKRESQLSAWASDQSRPVPDRSYLESRVEGFGTRFKDRIVPRPPRWGGFILMPSWFEFWQEGEHRLHDRISYTLIGNLWKIERLAP
jgi:pyridoxamine 5'-phosphate oxidase